MEKFNDFKDDIKKQRQLWYLPKPWILEELYSRKLILAAIAAICLTLLLLLIWATIARIDESAIAQGELVPVGNVKIVQHLEGGIIEKIFIKNGQLVKKGEPLLELNNVAFKSELRRLKTREATLQSDAKRLQAYIENNDLQSHAHQANHQATTEEQALLSIQLKAKRDQVNIITQQIEQKEKEIARLKEQIRLTQDKLKLTKEEEMMFAKLSKDGTVSHRDYLRVKQLTIQAEKELLDFKTQFQQANDALEEAQVEQEKITSTLNETAAKELDTIKGEINEIKQAIIKLQDRVRRTLIRAPATGIVKGLVATVAQIIPSNGEILTIVPQDTDLEVIAHVQPKDIGHIKIGDTAVIKIFAYDFSRYGAIKGTVANLSATTFLDERELPYYKATIILNNQYVNQPSNKLRAGMTAQVDIITGSKTILQYLLKPIHITLKNSLNER